MLDGGLLTILDKIHQHNRCDFRQYKESTIKRRVQRRLRATKAQSYQQYTAFLDTDPGEYAKLVDDLTINVTEFFRNPEAWQVIKETILPELVRQKDKCNKQGGNKKPLLRVWSAGCASGEEVYSVAILLDQLLGPRRDSFEIDIRGTDIDKQILLKAQQAEYNLEMLRTSYPDILNNYFDSHSNSITKSSLGVGLQFKHRDLVLDEPFKQVDLIVCRNVVIYFSRSLQAKVFMDFCNSLNEGGFLFLGKAETLIGPAMERFKAIDKRWRIYRKVATERQN